MYRKGFTLIELLLVIGILSLLASIVISAVNPRKQLAGARDAQRWSDVTNFLESFSQYAVDNSGRYQPQEVGGQPLDPGCALPIEPTAAKKVCKETTPHGSGVGECGDTITPANQCVYATHLVGTYIVSLAPDPTDNESGAESLRIDYTVRETASGRLEVSAPNAEGVNPITKTR